MLQERIRRSVPPFNTKHSLHRPERCAELGTYFDVSMTAGTVSASFRRANEIDKYRCPRIPADVREDSCEISRMYMIMLSDGATLEGYVHAYMCKQEVEGGHSGEGLINTWNGRLTATVEGLLVTKLYRKSAGGRIMGKQVIFRLL